MTSLVPPSTTRKIIRSEALSWLAANPVPPGSSVITSLPDVSEFPERDLDQWRAWFLAAVEAVLRWVPETGVTIFFQSDIRHEGEWIDKGYLVLRAAEQARAHLLWHHIVCREPAGTPAFGRATYSHLLCVSGRLRPAPQKALPDVLPAAGFMPFSKATGVSACRMACEYLRNETSTRIVVDPFCRQGTVLAVANAHGFEAIGIDWSARKCRAAKRLVLSLPEGEP